MQNANLFVVKTLTTESSGYIIKSVSTSAVGPGGCVVIHTEEEKRVVYVKENTDYLIPEIPPRILHVPIFPSPAAFTPVCTEVGTNTECSERICNSTQTCLPEQSNISQQGSSSSPPAQGAAPCQQEPQPGVNQPPEQQQPGTSQPPEPPTNQQQPGTGQPPEPPTNQQQPGTGQPPEPATNQQRPGTGQPPEPPTNQQPGTSQPPEPSSSQHRPPETPCNHRPHKGRGRSRRRRRKKRNKNSSRESCSSSEYSSDYSWEFSFSDSDFGKKGKPFQILQSDDEHQKIQRIIIDILAEQDPSNSNNNNYNNNAQT